MSWFKDLVTGKDNETHDLGRWSWIGSFVAVVAHQAWQLWHGATTSIIDLSTALTAVAAGHGFALWSKKDTEPAKKEE